MNTMNKVGVVLLSGGLDSTTVAALAMEEGYDVHAITFRYAESTKKEVEAAGKVVQSMGLKHEVIGIPYQEIAWYSALTNPTIDLPETRREEEITSGEIPSSYVPMRNTAFITLATAYLESEVLKRIEEDGADPQDIKARVFIAANALDYSGYPDCRPEYYQKINDLMRSASKAGTQYNVDMRVETPLLYLKKKDIAERGVELGAPLEWTWSCYRQEEIPCGECDSCILRKKGFSEAGFKDPLLERLEKEKEKEEGKF